MICRIMQIEDARVGSRGVLRIQVTGMIEQGQKSTPPPPPKKINPQGFKKKKKSVEQNLTPNKIHNGTIMALAPNKFHAEFPSHKNQFHRNYAAEIRGNYQESPDCFEYPQKSLLKSSYPQKNTFQNILTPQKIRKQEISNLKKFFDHPCPLKSGVIFPLPPWGLVIDRGG